MSMNEKIWGGWVGFLNIFHTLLLHQPLQKECVLWLDMRIFNYESLFKIGSKQVNSMLGVSARVGFTSFLHKTNTYLPTKYGNSSLFRHFIGAKKYIIWTLEWIGVLNKHFTLNDLENGAVLSMTFTQFWYFEASKWTKH